MSELQLNSLRLRGQPIIALLMILAIWLAVRLLTWYSPIDQPRTVFGSLGAQFAEEIASADFSVKLPLPQTLPLVGAGVVVARVDAGSALVTNHQPQRIFSNESKNLIGLAELAALSVQEPGLANSTPANTSGNGGHVKHAVGHTLLLAAGFSQIPLAPEIEEYLRNREMQPAGGRSSNGVLFNQLAAQNDQQFGQWGSSDIVPEEQSDVRRWSMDAWALWREDDSMKLVAGGMAGRNTVAGQPSYGRSQIGAVLRYRLAPSSPQSPQAYLRATSALEGNNEREAAFGLSARLFKNLPVRLAVEGRLSERSGNGRGNEQELRGAVYGVTELAPFSLPLNTKGEAYVQAGYVSGQDETAFIDGQVRIMRDIAKLDDFRLQAGAGVWGGAQKGANRVDIGPSVSASVRIGNVNTRLSGDYRMRVAGDARPNSGPTLTLSAGF